MSVSTLKKYPLETIALPMPQGGPWTLAKSQAYCLEMAKREPQSNQIAYWYLDKALRPHVATLYAFQRTMLDLGSEELLHAWEAALGEAFRGRAEHPVFVALRQTISEYDLPITPFKDLIIGARMALTQTRFTSFQALITYVEKIGTPLGRIILYLARDTDIEHIRAASDIMTAITLSTMWTHLDENFNQRGRLHIPQEDMLRFGVSEADITQRRATPAFRTLLDFQLSRTRMYLMRGRPLCTYLPDDLQREVQMIWFGANTALDKIERDGVFGKAPIMGVQDWVRASVRLGRWRLKEMTQW